MAKINIPFDNTNYPIDESSLSSASAALQSHLSTVMNGTGAAITLGGTTYNIDSAKLTAATNAFITHLGTVAGSGKKVVVGGVEYNIDSTKMADAIADLHNVLGGLESEGNDNICLLENQQISFTYHSNLGFYAHERLNWFEFIEGDAYTVIWDDVTYTLTAYSATLDSTTVDGSDDYIIIGNEEYLKNGINSFTEPFAMLYRPDVGWCAICSIDTEGYHNVALYKV